MLSDVYSEMISLTEADRYCRDFYCRTGSYMENPTAEEIRFFLRTWGNYEQLEKFDRNIDLLKEKDLKFAGFLFRESFTFQQEKDISILAANRYFKMFPHSHEYFEIACVLEGSAIHNPGQDQICLNKGDIVIVPPGVGHNLQPIDDATVVDIEIRFSTFENTFRDILSSGLPLANYLKNSLYCSANSDCIILENAIDEIVSQILFMVYHENKIQSYISNKFCIDLTESLLYHLAEKSTAERIFSVIEYRNEEIFQIRRFIAEHLHEMSLELLSARFHRSSSSLSRYIKSKSGISYSALLQNIRLERAKELLSASDQSIHEIAFSVGYDGESHFIALFRKAYGITPLQYRLGKRNSQS